ncbi:histone-like nucleoid-structuring protein Lsr2 [Amycolatopsis sp. RTGN1]|uniref:histone-like nucleoid-structuring protein Lsr2 n=1 Tax=Amycolatopsis ponsaeliensis TaxID=2992142 RepID=UPI00254E9F69|nr:Lsr2 family protein [Amycolatopsis sp. RTGN1]
MATKETVITVDDISGNPAVATKKFALDGVHYEIDLDADNLAYLEELLLKYASAGRRVGGRKTSPKSVSEVPASAQSQPDDLKGQVRAWAGANGYTVASVGRLSNKVIQAYLKATNPRTKGSRKRS